MIVTRDPLRRRRSSIARRVLANPLGLISALWLVAVVLAVISAGLWDLPAPNYSQLADAFAPPGPDHLLGADSAGRDILSRLLWGGQISLAATVIALVVAVILGVPSGLLAGYFGKSLDVGFGWVNDLLMAIPAMVVLLSVRSIVGTSVWISMTIFGVLLSTAFFRIVRSSSVSVRNELFVDAARTSGLTDGAIIYRHIFSAIRGPIIVQASFVAGIALALQTGLEFLGIGDREVPSWGNMLNEGFRNIYRAPSLMLWPALAITLVCAALALLGNALRDAYEPASPQIKPRSPGRRSVSANVAPVGTRETPDSPPALLSVEGLSIEYSIPNAESRRVVDGVSLHVDTSEIVGLVGESGSGKTQTALSVLGLLPSAADVVDGTIHFDGSELTTLSRRNRRAILGTGIAYIPQEPQANLDPSVRVGDQLIEPLRSRLKMSKAQARSRVTELLTKVGIADPARVMAAYPHQISGGMAQRVLIAGAVACEPKLLIADEPTTALDVTVQAEVLSLLRELQVEFSMGVLVVTHNFGVVADLCDRVYVMRSGSIVESNATQALFDAPQHEYTRTLLGAILSEETSRAQLDAAARSVR